MVPLSMRYFHVGGSPWTKDLAQGYMYMWAPCILLDWQTFAWAGSGPGWFSVELQKIDLRTFHVKGWSLVMAILVLDLLDSALFLYQPQLEECASMYRGKIPPLDRM
jgi:hypothetical protein